MRFAASPANGAERRAAWIDLLFRDFGVLRLFWKNRAQYASGAWRSNQPMPGDIAWAARTGIRTVINARHDAPRHGGHSLAREAAERHGIAYLTLESTPVFSRTAPSRETLLAIAVILRQVARPLLIHCKSGADRAGFLAAFDRIVTGGADVKEARKELSLRHLHFSGSKTGILDAVFETYLSETAAHPKPFLDWVAEDYDPQAIAARFRHGYFADLVDRFILRHE